MNHPHSDQRNRLVAQRAPALSPYIHLVNAPVSPLELHSSALIPSHHTEHPGLPPVVDGEVLSVHTIPAPTRTIEPKRNLLRRAIDDPFWILMTLTVTLGVSITATVIYGAIQIILAIGAWLDANATTIGGATALIILRMLCGGAKAAQCAGIHCGGCRRR